jgi:hypothetical protein
MNGIKLGRFILFCYLIEGTVGMNEFNNYINKYSSSLYTNFGDSLFQTQYIKEYNFFTKSNLGFDISKVRIQSLNEITHLFCKAKILNFLTQTLINQKVIDQNFEIINQNTSKEILTTQEEIIEKKPVVEDGGRKIEKEQYLDRKRKKIKIKGKIYEIPESWTKNGLETWNDFQNHVIEMISGKYKTVNDDFKDNLSRIIEELHSIDLDEICLDLIEQYSFLEASYIKYFINMDFSDDEEENM